MPFQLETVPLKLLDHVTGGTDLAATRPATEKEQLCAMGAFSAGYQFQLADPKGRLIPSSVLEARSLAIDGCDAMVAQATGQQGFLKNSKSLIGLVPPGTFSPPLR